MTPIRTSDQTEADRDTFEWGHLRWFASRAISDTDTTVGRCVIHPGHQNPLHRHPNCDEVLYVLSGRIEHVLGDARLPMQVGDSITIPAGIAHCAINVGDSDADLLIVFTSGERDFELA